ncbi:MAG: hypothetical protein Q8P91_01775 [bacterium]|nr:hypothetical protein [bacterium]
MKFKLLEVIKQSETGLTLPQLSGKCQQNEVGCIQPHLKYLIKEGLVRIDPKPLPPRVKAMKKAWPED